MQSNSANKQNEFVKLSLTLFGITFVVAALLALVNFVTAPKISELKEQKLTQAMKIVMPEAASFEDATASVLEKYTAETEIVNVQIAKDASSNVIGYCIETAPMGYSNKIDMMVGLNADGEIVNTSIISISDTPGIGMQVQTDKSFAEQFVGKSGEKLDGIKTGTPSSSEAALISGATYSSGGFLNGVNAALSAFKIMTEEVK